MYKFIQRNQKKMLAIFGVGLMIVFILPTVAFDKRRGTMQEVVGHLGGEEVHALDLRDAHDQWRGLLELDITGDVGVVGDEIEKNPALFVLLQKEAMQLGLRVPDAQVDETLALVQRFAPMRGRSVPNPAELKPALRNLMLVQALFQRVARGVKPSGPLVTRELADQSQRVKLELVHYAGEDFKKNVPAPTEEQVKAQFEQLKNSPPGVPTAQNPFGFGYRVPAMVRLHYLTVPREEVARAVRKSKSEFDWRVAALMHYRDNPARYPATQTAETQPAATQPIATTRPTTGPTTRPFAEVQEQVIHELMNPDIDRKLEEISTALYGRLDAEYREYQKKSTAAPGDFGTRQHLERVAADVEKRHGIKLGVSEINEPKTQEALAELKGIGQSFVGERSFAQYVMRWAGPLLPPTQTGPTEVLSLDEPSPRLRDAAGNVYVFQLKEATPAHAPADVNAVKAKVEEDVRTRLAFESAAAAARKLRDAAAAGRLAPAAESAKKDLFTTPDFFARNGETIDRKPAVLIPQVELPEEARDLLLNDAFKQLTQATPDKPHPISSVELPSAGRVVVYELADVERGWRDDQQKLAEFEATRELTGRNAQRVLRKYFSYEAVKDRMGYQPTNAAG